LPLPRLPLPIARPVLYCAVTPMDDRGRLADRSTIRAAGWQPGQPVTITATPGHRLVTVSAGGQEVITGYGHLRLPARVRHAFHLSPGDRLLITVIATPPRLAVYPMATLDEILSQHAPTSAADTP
jgi:bifunctional DNA-binding transcriptional regulator/antitoxin component of YhaV-PrlF toxin-antitoxin module